MLHTPLITDLVRTPALPLAATGSAADTHAVFAELALVLLIAAGAGGIGLLLRLPLIVAFIAAGILAGPAALNLVSATHEMELLAEIGISLLLFVVGLKLDPYVIRSMGAVALAAGIVQIALSAIIALAIGLALGMAWIPAIFIATALAFSSTVIIVKMLSDRREIDALHGKLAVGVLIVQDIVIVIVMIALSAFGAAPGQPAPGNAADPGMLYLLAIVALKGTAFLASIALLARFILPRVVRALAHSKELLILFAIAWAVALAAAGDTLGFSKEVGAFLAGVSLAASPFRETISGRLTSIRDFLLLFFFIHLGASVDPDALAQQIAPAIALSAFVLIGKPLIVIAILGALGYTRRTAFLTGISLAQISEFSLILAAIGLSIGAIDDQHLGLITLVGLITIGISSYLITFSHHIFEKLAPALAIFERRRPARVESATAIQRDRAPVVLFGLGRYGSNIAAQLKRSGIDVLGIDFDPRVVDEWNRRGRHAMYADASDPEFAAHLPRPGPLWIVCSVPSLDHNLTLLRSLREHAVNARFAGTAHNTHDANRLQQAGADLVMLPFVDAADRAANMLIERLQPPAND